MVLVIEILGWIGAILILAAFFLLTHHDLTSRSRIYQGMNLIGAVLLAINLFFNKAYPSLVINIIWFFIAIYGFYNIYKNKIKKRKR
ncbi:hypothetical protein HOD38_02765 [archaeon]|jgi:hypothetical protein|nr:hypothetical protein [archaeon]MBT4397163.1 hypothetical protein [archaeon]MBT4441531.1 hypothetical protein [archaeon]